MENTNNSVVISLSERMKSLNPVDRVNEIAATVLYDPKHVESMTCYPAVRTYLTKVPGLNFILESEAKRKWKLSEILSEEEKDKCANCPVYEFRFDDETMTMIVHREGNKELRPIGLIVNHVVVLDTNMNYTCNARAEFEDKEFGVFEWFSKITREVINDDKDKSFLDNLVDKQVENFRGMKYQEKFEKLSSKLTFKNLVEVPVEKIQDFSKTVVDIKEDQSFLESLKETQIRNFKEVEYEKKINNFVDSVVGKERSFESFKAQQIENAVKCHGENFQRLKKMIVKEKVESVYDYKGSFPLKFVGKDFEFEEMQNLIDAFPKTFLDDYGIWIKQSMIHFNIIDGDYKYHFCPPVRGMGLEYVHFSLANGKDIYAIEGDYVAIEACHVTEDEIAQILKFQEELDYIKSIKRLQTQLKLKDLMLKKAKEIIKEKNDLKMSQLAAYCKKAYYQHQINLEQKARDDEIARQIAVKEEKRMQQLEFLDRQSKINEQVAEEAIVLNPKIKQFLTSFDPEKRKLIQDLGFELTNLDPVSCYVVDPKKYRKFFVQIKEKQWKLNLDKQEVKDIEILNDGKDVYINNS